MTKFQSFLNFLGNYGFITSKAKLREVVSSYTFLEISEENESKLNSKISQNFQESKVIIISHYKEQFAGKDIRYFVLSFKRTILVINETRLKKLQTFFSTKEKLEICFLFDTKVIFDDAIHKFIGSKIKYKEIQNDEKFKKEIEAINLFFFNKQNQNFPHDDILKIIKSSISGYLIKQNYYTYDRIDDFNDKIKPREITEDEIIELRFIGTGSVLKATLCFYIEYEKLIIIKKEHLLSTETEKLLNREIRNYREINHPFIPKFYGTIKNNDLFYPAIEFIKGTTLKETDLSQFSETEIFEIIFQMLLVFNYLHNNHFIYRDLKPNNVMIDKNKTFVLIDFDRMIKDDENTGTIDFQLTYSSPEIKSNNITNKCDIYSIGKMINFIINKNESMKKKYENTKLFQIFKKCINDKTELRPKSSELIEDLIFFIKENKINFNKSIHYYSLATNQNIPEVQNDLGLIYYEGQYIPRDINKSIYYFSLATNQNIPEVQNDLGLIYYEGQYISRDINKAIYYLSLAANQNYPQAQYNLGIIYLEGQYIQRDINKAIHYFSLAANHNIPQAQYNLGVIYLTSNYIFRDINKAIYFFSLSANQNHTGAQYNLGIIYLEGKYIQRDINKAIYYLSLAANQNYPQAQNNLGIIYLEGQYIQRDINKAIYYFSLAANKNIPQAQINLGIIYSEGKYIQRDYNKAIYYFTLAANHNIPQAQFNLGVIHEKGIYILRNINKAIYYYSLASNQNEPQSQNNLGTIYLEGKYIARDINKAIYYFTLAANKNDPQAQFNLGNVYYSGYFISRDINKAIYYLSLAANQNHPQAQNNLGIIYLEGKYIQRDINKAIHYFSLAANQNDPHAQNNLGFIYSEGKYIQRDINKAIHYFSLAVNQNHPQAQNNLGIIYSEGKYIQRDINKAIHYFSLAVNQNNPQAQYNLGKIYSDNQYFTKDINKAIYYYSLAANQNIPQAQFIIGLYYYYGYFIKQNISKAINCFLKSSENNFTLAHFSLGFIYQEGKYLKRDMKKSIHHYKEASSFNNKYAKNNLGIIYKHGIGVEANLANAKIYFEEAIKEKSDPISMYNLAHIYIYEEFSKESIDKSIELLKESSSIGFSYSKELLNIALVKKYGDDIKNIKDIKKGIKHKEYQSDSQYSSEDNFLIYKNIDFLYDAGLKEIVTQDIYLDKIKPNSEFNVTKEFYEGFGIILN